MKVCRAAVRFISMRQLAATLALLSLAPQIWAEEPIIEPDRVVFPETGQIVQFEPETVIEHDEIDAMQSAGVVKVQRSAILIRPWRRVLLRSVSLLYEGSAEEIAVYDYSGNLIGTTPYLGPILLSPMKHRFFACEVESHYGTTHAYLVDETGTVRSEIEHLGAPTDCSTTPDKRLVLIESMVIRRQEPDEGHPLGVWNVVVRAFDFDGKMIARLESDKKGIQVFEADGRRYEVTLREPSPP